MCIHTHAFISSQKTLLTLSFHAASNISSQLFALFNKTYIYLFINTNRNTHNITWFRSLIFLAKTWNDFNCFKNVHNVTLTHQDWYVQKLFFAKTFPAHYFRQANVEMIIDIKFAAEKYYLPCVELYFNLIAYWSLSISSLGWN